MTGTSSGPGLRARLSGLARRLVRRGPRVEEPRAADPLAQTLALLSSVERDWDSKFARVERQLQADSRAALPAPVKTRQFDALHDGIRKAMMETLQAKLPAAKPLVGKRRRAAALRRAQGHLTALLQYLAGVEERASAESANAAAAQARAEAAVRAARDDAALEALEQARDHARMASALSREAAEGRSACEELQSLLDALALE